MTDAKRLCERCGGELSVWEVDRSGTDYWCPECTKVYAREMLRREVIELRRALRQQDGVVVPREPTEKMRQWFKNVYNSGATFEEAYYAMIAAAETTDNICEHCGGKVSSYPKGCPKCGAPQCCQRCCDATDNVGGPETNGLTAKAGGKRAADNPPAPDALVRRLLSSQGHHPSVRREAADRIEADQRRIAELEAFERAAHYWQDRCNAATKRAEKAEAALRERSA